MLRNAIVVAQVTRTTTMTMTDIVTEPASNRIAGHKATMATATTTSEPFRPREGPLTLATGRPRPAYLVEPSVRRAIRHHNLYYARNIDRVAAQWPGSGRVRRDVHIEANEPSSAVT